MAARRAAPLNWPARPRTFTTRTYSTSSRVPAPVPSTLASSRICARLPKKSPAIAIISP
jgi:hypothetical protein